MKNGKFIVLEGADGCGKTTQINLLKKHYPEAVFVREPGGTLAGEKIREILLSKEKIPLYGITEVLLFAAARAQLLQEKIIPALNAGKLVISDRFLLSSLVFQGIVGEVNYVKEINGFALGGYHPDATFLLEISDEESVKRRHDRNVQDRYESMDDIFHQKVTQGYREIAKSWDEKTSGKLFRLNGEYSAESIHLKILNTIQKKC